MKHRTIRGRIRYISKKADRLDTTRGGETFIYTVHGDGRRTLRTHCAIEEPDPTILRDTVTNLDPDWTPTGGFVQITVDDRLEGQAWYDFEGGQARCEGRTRPDGVISATASLSAPPDLFVTHPLQADALMLQNYDLSAGPGEQTTAGFFSCSLHHRGADGPGLFTREDGITLAFIAEEKRWTRQLPKRIVC